MIAAAPDRRSAGPAAAPAEDFQVLAGVIAAHPGRRVVGRTRLQKEIMLLQRVGLPTTYNYGIHFYGPYSDGLHAELGLLERFRLIEQEERTTRDGSTYYILTATPRVRVIPPEVECVRGVLDLLAAERNPVVLELAATYDTFRLGDEHAAALDRLRRKKRSKCEGGNEAAALDLLRRLGLWTEEETMTPR